MQEMQAQSLGREEPLEEEMATHSSILPWRIPWTEEPGGSYCLIFIPAPFLQGEKWMCVRLQALSSV